MAFHYYEETWTTHAAPPKKEEPDSRTLVVGFISWIVVLVALFNGCSSLTA